MSLFLTAAELQQQLDAAKCHGAFCRPFSTTPLDERLIPVGRQHLRAASVGAAT